MEYLAIKRNEIFMQAIIWMNCKIIYCDCIYMRCPEIQIYTDGKQVKWLPRNDCLQTCNIFGDEMFFQWIVVIVAQLYKFTNTH